MTKMTQQEAVDYNFSLVKQILPIGFDIPRDIVEIIEGSPAGEVPVIQATDENVRDRIIELEKKFDEYSLNMIKIIGRAILPIPERRKVINRLMSIMDMLERTPVVH